MEHHAQLVRTTEIETYTHPETTATQLRVYLEKLGIDDVRQITDQALLRPATNQGQIFIIATTFVTHEAQNALLKLFEEPPTDTSFVLVVPPAFQLLSTLQSRIGHETVHTNTAQNTAWDDFAAALPADRLQQIDTWQKSKDPQWLAEIVRGLHTLPTTSLVVDEARVVQFVGQKLQTRGASNKMLLEHLALVLPLRK